MTDDPPSPGADHADADDNASDAPRTEPVEVRRGGKGRGKRNPLPWYRRGSVWFWFVVVTAIGAWVLSGWAEDRLSTFTTQPGSADAAVLCEATPDVAGYGLFAPGGVPADVPEQVAGWLSDGTEAHAALVVAAPDEVEADAIEARDAFAEVVAAHAAAPEDGAGAAAADAWDRARADHDVAVERLDRLALGACGEGLVVWRAAG